MAIWVTKKKNNKIFKIYFKCVKIKSKEPYYIRDPYRIEG